MVAVGKWRLAVAATTAGYGLTVKTSQGEGMAVPMGILPCRERQVRYGDVWDSQLKVAFLVGSRALR
jgi:hypothetical protein